MPLRYWSYLLLVLLGIKGELSAQVRCGFDEMCAHHIAQMPAASERALAATQRAYTHWLANRSGSTASRNSCEIYTIPVVFHVVYADPTANISDAQILSQVEILNQDYRRMNNSPGEGPGVDTRIQFCLATLDPVGDSTTGITRTLSSLGAHRTSEEDQLKSLIAWDDQRYLNVWVTESVTLIDPSGQDPPSAILAYASFPTLPNGLPQGVVIDHRYLGNQGTAVPPFNAGRTLTHEVGHFLGLYHPFESDGICSGATEGSCLNNGDRVCDTPSQLSPTYGCPSVAGNSCIDTPCDLPDPEFNYLNYTDDACMNAFTAGQAARMQFFLQGARASLITPANLASTGCEEGPIVNHPIADFAQSEVALCLNGTVVFEDISEGCPDMVAWSFPGGTPSTATTSLVEVNYPLPGTYPVTLIVSNASGSDTITRSTSIRTSVAVQAEDWTESFESILFPPLGWQVHDVDEQGGWIRSNEASRSGQFCAVMRHFDSPSCGMQDILISPPLEMSGKAWQLHFSHAYQRRSTSSTDADELQVAISDTCGAPWLPVFFKAGAGLATVSGTQSSGPFVPGSGEWVESVVDLSQFSDRSHLRIRFQTNGRNGQNLYLDDIRLSPSTFVSLDPELAPPALFPNPFDRSLSLRHPAWAGKEIEIILLDPQGRSVWQMTTVLDGAGEGSWQIDLPSGLYVIRIGQGAHWYREMMICK